MINFIAIFGIYIKLNITILLHLKKYSCILTFLWIERIRCIINVFYFDVNSGTIFLYE